MLATLALALLVSEAPARQRLAFPAIDDRGAKLSADALSKLHELASISLMELSLVEVVTTTLAPAKLRACPGLRCDPALARQLGSDEAILVRVLAFGPVCAVSASWWSFEERATRSAALREGGCGEVELVRSIQAALLAVAHPAALARPPDVVRSSDCVSEEGDYMGYATVDSEPYSRISWRGAELGETPLTRIRLPVGCVELVATTADGASKKVRIRVEPNRSQRYRFAFESAQR